jgi:hypothetical protein
MGLTKSQATIWQKARTLGSGGQAVTLTDGMCNYLLAVIAHDLGVAEQFSEFSKVPLPFFSNGRLSNLSINGCDPREVFERLVNCNRDADTYFACLAALHKARLKYERILSTQPVPTLEQVGPRGLLQYGTLTGRALAGLLFWRKWFFDIDNRAGQETGYLFEPIIANAIGGTPAPATKSPVRRHGNNSKGRQVDCLLEKRAYELKIRVTIAASGQGRWQEELDFPVDCHESGFTPVLVCMDSTQNPKLDSLVTAFEKQNGEVYVGEAAWQHLDSLAGATMAKFLDTYVKSPIQDLLKQGTKPLPDLVAHFTSSSIDITIGGETLHIDRAHGESDSVEQDEMPEDIADVLGES